MKATSCFKRRQPTPLADQSYICQLSPQVFICFKTKVLLSNAEILIMVLITFSFLKLTCYIYRAEIFWHLTLLDTSMLIFSNE